MYIHIARSFIFSENGMEYGEDYVEVNKFLSESIFHFFKGGCLSTRATPPPAPHPLNLKLKIW